MAEQLTGSVQHLNPDTLHKNPAFTQVVVVSGPARTIYVGGQNAVDVEGNIVGEGDLKAQVEQTFKNMQAALEAADAGMEHVIKWTIYVVQGQDIRQGFGVFQQVWGNRPNPPTISTLFVAGLANPSFLCEIDAVAVVPQ